MMFLITITTILNYHFDMKMLGKSVLIEPDVLPERTITGALVIPRNSKEMLPQWGTARDVGPSCVQVKKGDRVYFPRKVANVIVIDDKDFYIINEHKIFYHE